VATARILKIDGQWHCQGCGSKMRATPQAKGKTVKYGRVDGILPGTCATCHEPIGRRRGQINVHGHLVHYRCPKKSKQPTR